MKLWQRLKEQNPFRFQEYKRSRAFFTFEGTFATIIGALSSGAILAGYLEYIGIPEQFNGMVLAIPVMANLLQPFGAYLFEGMRRKKPLFLLLLLIHRSLLALMFLVPLLISDTAVRVITLVAIYATSNFLLALPAVSASNWIFHLTNDRNRAKYLAIRERFMIFVSAILALCAGSIIDYFKSQNNLNGGYIVVFALIALAAVGNAFCISLLKEPASMCVIPEKRQNLFSSFLLPFKTSSYRPILLITILYQFATQTFVPYWGIYQVNVLHLPYTYLMALTFFAAIEKSFVVSLWARLSSRTNWAFCTMLALSIMALANILNIFAVPKTAYIMTIIPCIIGQVSWAAVNMCFFNIQCQNAPAENRTVYIGMGAAISAVFGFIGVLFASFLMWLAKKVSWSFLGTDFRGQQMQMIIGTAILLFTAWYIFYTFKKRGLPMKFRIWER